jgi:hypothetical protein
LFDHVGWSSETAIGELLAATDTGRSRRKSRRGVVRAGDADSGDGLLETMRS